MLYLGQLLVVHVPDRGDLPGVGLLNGGDLLLQAAILQLQASHILNVGSEPEECFKLRKVFQNLNQSPHLSFNWPSCFFSSVLDILVGDRGEGGLGLTAGAGLSRALRRELRLDILVCYGGSGNYLKLLQTAQVGMIIR